MTSRGSCSALPAPAPSATPKIAPPRKSRRISRPGWRRSSSPELDRHRHSGAHVSANPESRDSPICTCTSEVWSFGPSRNDLRNSLIMVALRGKEIDAFLARPDPGRPIILLYALDAGLVRQRAGGLLGSAARDPTHP